MINLNFIKEVGPAQWVYRTLRRQFAKRVLKTDLVLKLPTGVQIVLPKDNQFGAEAYITQADVDWGSENLLFLLLTRSGCFLDVGAHIGYYTAYMSPGVVSSYAFEPDPRTIKHLQRNIQNIPNAEAVPKAVGRSVGNVWFSLEASPATSHLSSDTSSAAEKIRVDLVTIDDFVREKYLKVEAIKTDVEGFDLDVIIGSREVLCSQKPIVLTEAKPTAELFSFMTGIGYSVLAYTRHPITRRRKFETLTFPVNHEIEVKMLFLIPQERHAEVIAKAEMLA